MISHLDCKGPVPFYWHAIVGKYVPNRELDPGIKRSCEIKMGIRTNNDKQKTRTNTLILVATHKSKKKKKRKNQHTRGRKGDRPLDRILCQPIKK